MQTSPFPRQFSGYAIAHLVAWEKGVINKETGFLDEVWLKWQTVSKKPGF